MSFGIVCVFGIKDFGMGYYYVKCIRVGIEFG